MFNLKFALSHFFHQLKAINRHGLHSPFVYRLVDEVIYDFSDKKVYTDIEKAQQPHKKLNAADKLLYRLVADWQPHSVNFIGKCTSTDHIILNHAASESSKVRLNSNTNFSKNHNVIFTDAAIDSSSKQAELQNVLATLQEGVMLVIKNSHQNHEAHALWKSLKFHPQVTVSVDLFWLGLIYHRPGQVKEDFLIKF